MVTKLRGAARPDPNIGSHGTGRQEPVACSPLHIVTEEWTEFRRQPVGLYASGPVRGPGWGNLGYYHLVYEVSEHRQTDKGGEHRLRIENGPACRTYGEGYAAFCDLYAVYWG